MAEKNFETILSDLKKKDFARVYILHGNEPFFIDEIISYMENNIVEEEMKAFNQTVVYGRDVSARDVSDIAQRIPMMAGGYHLVIVKEAQELLSNNKKLDDLYPYIENPSNSTILVLGIKNKTLDKRTKFYKNIIKRDDVVIFESSKLYENQIPGWIERYVSARGYKINAKATMLLADHVGADLGRLVNEVNKLFINLPENGEITPELIEKYIGISKDFNIFEFTKALDYKDSFKAQRIVKYFESNPKENPLQMITVMLYNHFVKVFLFHKAKTKNKFELAKFIGVSPNFVNDYAVAAGNYPTNIIRKIIREIKILDMKSKGFGSSDAKDYGPLKEFVFKCIHGTFPVFKEEEL